MDNTLRKQLLEMLQEISYGFDEFAESLEAGSDERFWQAWSAMHKFISDQMQIREK